MAEQVDQIINKMTGGAETGAQDASTKGNGGGQLMYCDAKSQQELNEFVDSEKPKLVALVGFADFGKSTFIGALYQQLIEKLSYKGYAFVDSETYVGFERRVFLRRVNGEDISDTKRNILKENDILHLKLRSDKGHTHQVLISDKAGETYARYSSSVRSPSAEIRRIYLLSPFTLQIYARFRPPSCPGTGRISKPSSAYSFCAVSVIICLFPSRVAGAPYPFCAVPWQCSSSSRSSGSCSTGFPSPAG